MKTQAIINHIVKWLKDYAEENHQNGFVVGVSGGIDSALTSTLCAKTGLDVLCLEMPIHQSENQVSRALNHIEWLQNKYPKVKMTQVNLTPVFESLLKALPEVNNEEDRLMSLANTRARLRMTSLYYFAALHGYLVAGTGNKVEDFGVGFYTKYGDGGVDVSPIADLLKTDVYKLAKALGINNDILIAPPTDGLWGDSRTDEDQIGASYPELEWAMKMNNEGKKTSNFKGREKEVFDIFMDYNSKNQHKMQPIPVCEIPSDLKS